MQMDEKKKWNCCHEEALLLLLFFLSQHPNYLGNNKIIQKFWLEVIFKQPGMLGLTALAKAVGGILV